MSQIIVFWSKCSIKMQRKFHALTEHVINNEGTWFMVGVNDSYLRGM